MQYKITDKPSEKDKDEIFKQLLKYNMSHLENKEPKDIAVFIEDDNGKKLGGLIGETHGNWLEVEYLWVSQELRGRKIGTELLKKAEDTARERGCKYVFLNTFGFQAPDFYTKLGYKEQFTLENYPVTGKRHYYTKEL